MNNFALNLLAGSRALDQMRKEINDLLLMVDGLVRANAARDGLLIIDEAYRGNKCTWKLKGIVGQGKEKDFLKVECKTDLSGTVLSFPKVRDPFPPVDEHRFSPEDVLLVHADMDTILNGLRRAIPGLETGFSPFYKAADIVSSR